MLKQVIKKLLSPDRLHSARVFYSNFFGNNKIKGKRGNKISLNGALMTGCSITFYGKNNCIELGGGNSLNNSNICIYGSGCDIIIGSNNSFRHTTFWLEDSGSQIIIGNNNCFTGRLQLAAVEGTQVSIGDDCLFSSEIQIMTTDSHSILDNDGKRINPSKSIQLNNHIWVGTRAIILKGVNLASNIIVGAGSIVNKSIEEEGVAVGGNPAKVVKRGINWNTKRI